MARQVRLNKNVNTICDWIIQQALQRKYTPISLNTEDETNYYISFWSLIQTLQKRLCDNKPETQCFAQLDIAPYLSLLLNKVCLTLANCNWEKKIYEKCNRVWIHPACQQILSTKWLNDHQRCTWLKQLSLPRAEHVLLEYKTIPIWLHGIFLSDNPKPKLTKTTKGISVPQHEQSSTSTQLIPFHPVKKFLNCFGCFLLHPKARAALQKCTIQSPQRTEPRGSTSRILPIIHNPISDGANQQQPLLLTQYDD